MAKSFDIQSAEFAVESGNYGALDTATGLPDISGLTFEQIGFLSGEFTSDFEEPFNAAEFATGGDYDFPNEPETTYNQSGSASFGNADGAPMLRHRGSATFRFRPKTLGSGTNFASYQAMPWVKMLKTTYSTIEPTSATDAVASAAANAFTFEPTTPGDFAVGEVIGVWINGVLETNVITKIDGGTPLITCAHTFSRALTSVSSDEVRHGFTLYSSPGASLATGCIRMTVEDQYWYMLGGRVTAVEKVFEGETMFLDITFTSPCVLPHPDGSATPVDTWTRPDGATLQKLQSYQILTAETVLEGQAGGHAGGGDGGLTRGVITAYNWTWSLETALDFTPGNSNILSASAADIGRTKAKAEVMTTVDDTLRRMLNKREQRGLGLGYGPMAVGMGGAFYIKGAFSEEIVAIGRTDNGAQMATAKLAAGRWPFDDGSSGAAGSTWAWGMFL